MQRRLRAAAEHKQHAGRARTKSRFVLPGFGTANAGAGQDFLKADLDEFRTAGADGVIVSVAVFAGHDELVRKVVAARQPLHAAQIVAGQDGGGSKRERGRGAGSDQAGFSGGHLGDDF